MLLLRQCAGMLFGFGGLLGLGAILAMRLKLLLLALVFTTAGAGYLALTESGIRSISLTQPEIGWTVEADGIFEGRYGQDLVELEFSDTEAKHWTADNLEGILTEPIGWAGSGLVFRGKESSSPNQTRINFKLLSSEEIERVCSEDAAGCAAVVDEYNCDVYVDVAGWYTYARTTIVNHEIGHCLGFDHIGKSLMEEQVTLKHTHPTEEMLQQARLKLARDSSGFSTAGYNFSVAGFCIAFFLAGWLLRSDLAYRHKRTMIT